MATTKGSISNRERNIKLHDFSKVPGWDTGLYNNDIYFPDAPTIINANLPMMPDPAAYSLVTANVISHVYVIPLRLPGLMRQKQIIAAYKTHLCYMVDTVDGFPEMSLQTASITWGPGKDPIVVPTWTELTGREQLTFTTMDNGMRTLWKLIDWWLRGISDPRTGIYHGHGNLSIGELVRRDPRGYSGDFLVIVTNQHPSPDGVLHAGLLVNAFPSDVPGNITSASVEAKAEYAKVQVKLNGTYFQDQVTTLVGKYIMAATGAWTLNETNVPRPRQLYDLLRMSPEDVGEFADLTNTRRPDRTLLEPEDLVLQKKLFDKTAEIKLPYMPGTYTGTMHGGTDGNTFTAKY